MELKAKQTKQGIARDKDLVKTISQPGDLLVDPISRLNAVDCHRQGCGTGASAKGSNKGTEITNTTYMSDVLRKTKIHQGTYPPMLKMNVKGLLRVTAK